MVRGILPVVFSLLSLSSRVLSIGHEPCASFSSKGSSANSTFPLVSRGKAATIYVSPDDWPGVNELAVEDFASDVYKVTGHKPTIVNSTSLSAVRLKSSKSRPVIIVGTLGRSNLVSDVLNASSALQNSSFNNLKGQWESYLSQAISLPGFEAPVYTIIGSDKRGTIYALYELSEQIGVSPWYWWADVPVKKHDNLFLSSCAQGPPSVKYRGLFLNDEQPSLQNWAQEKFTNGTGPPFNHQFYVHVFNLLLRLRANYLWPAMWSGMFGEDDLLNQPLADKYGIVMGTSHQEPMARSSPNEWNAYAAAGDSLGDWNFTTNAANLTKFWTDGVERARPYETVYTIGMRGTGDLPLSEETNVQNLETIVSAQRDIIKNVYNVSDAGSVPQMWCLYSEVQGYYEDGMKVPDDVILLWADDNWGNVRRFPLENERNRTGGAGVYYHFDYVGGPRDYKWITTTQLSKVYEQMSLAYVRDAKSMWIVNVGDLKPYEREIEFFLTLGYDYSRFPSSEAVEPFVTSWASREFDVEPQTSTVITDIVANLTRLNARRKPELLNTTVYSLTNYREADNTLAEWAATFSASLAVYNSLPKASRPAYFQLVHHPVQASYQLQDLYIAAGKNNLYASQARLSTNALADQAQELFEADYVLEQEYHSIVGGKWDHFMDQTHVGYYYWQQPMQNTLPAVNRVPPLKQALAGAMRIAIEGSPGAWPGDNPYQCSLGYNCPPPTLPPLDPFIPSGTRWIDVSAGGPAPFQFSATSNTSSIRISPTSGLISKNNTDERLEISANWDSIEAGQSLVALITIVGTDPKGKAPPLPVQVYVTATKTSPSQGYKGFVEGDGGVSIEASHFARSTGAAENATWEVIPGYGRTLDGVAILPAVGNTNYSIGTGPSLEYDFQNFNTIGGSGNVTVHVYVSPSMNANGADRPLGFALQIDDETPEAIYYVAAAAPGQFPPGWGNFPDGPQSDNIIITSSNHTAAPGPHTLKLWGIEQAVVVQKIVIDTGGVRPSYLGPPESLRLA